MQSANTPKPSFFGRIKSFIGQETFPGIFLLFMAVLAMIFANTGLASSYFSWWDTELSLGVGTFAINMTLGEFINDGLMAVFFLMIGLEVKREILVGELSTGKKAAFPIVAALGGMLAPALIYVIFNVTMTGGNIDGFGIPMATDIAFALGVLLLLGKRVPLVLKVLLMSLAVADDLGAIIIIAVFYSTDISFVYLGVAAVMLVILLLLNKGGVRSLVPYLLIGLVVWYCFEHSGVHATIAGVLVALTIPANMKMSIKQYTAEGRIALDELDHAGKQVMKLNKPMLSNHQTELMEEFGAKYKDVVPPLMRLETALHTPVNMFILPLFAFANAGVALSGDGINLLSPIALGVIVGLVVGKPLGIAGLTFILSKIGIIEKPKEVTWLQIIGMGMIAGIGFTMSMFISLLAFSDPAFINTAKLAILIGSLTAGILGAIFMMRVTKKPPIDASSEDADILKAKSY